MRPFQFFFKQNVKKIQCVYNLLHSLITYFFIMRSSASNNGCIRFSAYFFPSSVKATRFSLLSSFLASRTKSFVKSFTYFFQIR